MPPKIDSTLLMRILLTVIFFLCLAFLPMLYFIGRKLNKTMTMLLRETQRKNYLTEQNHNLKQELEHYKELLDKKKK